MAKSGMGVDPGLFGPVLQGPTSLPTLYGRGGPLYRAPEVTIIATTVGISLALLGLTWLSSRRQT